MSRKLRSLFHETTLINIPHYFKLLLHFRNTSICVCLLVLSFLFMFQKVQSVQHWMSTNFVSLQEDNGSPIDAVSAALGMGKKTSSFYQTNPLIIHVQNYRISFGFNKQVASKLVENPEFLNFDFNFKIIKNEDFTGEKLSQECLGDQSCLINSLAGILPALYTITNPDREGIQFILEAHAANELTVRALIAAIDETINQDRIKRLRDTYEQQRAETERLILKKKDELIKLQYIDLASEKDILTYQLTSTDYEINIRTNHLIQNQTSLELSKAKANKTIGRGVSSKELSDLETDNRRELLRNNIFDLLTNINFIENDLTKKSESDQKVLESLKSDLALKQAELLSLNGHGVSLALDKDFIKKHQLEVRDDQTNYLARETSRKLQSDALESTHEKKNNILRRLVELKTKLETLQPNIEFLKALEAKVIQLRLQEITATSDLRFDSAPVEPSPSKKVSNLMLFVYSIMLSIFALILTLSIRYLLLDKFLDHEDFKRSYPEIPILGHTPQFKSN